MEPPKTEFEKLSRQYIIADNEGNITNVTDGLFYEMGLHTRFFNYTDSIFEMVFPITKICADITEEVNQEQLETEGKVMTFDTSQILNNIDLESLNADDI